MNYCSRRCQAADWRGIHKLECDHIKALKETYQRPAILNMEDGYGLIALRYCLKMQVDKEFRNKKWTLFNGSEQTLDDLLHHEDQATIRPSYLAEYQRIADEIMSLKISGLDRKTVLVRLGQLRNKSSAIVKELEIFHWDGNEPKLDAYGSGLYLPQTVIGHSCVPNAFGSFIGTIHTIRAIREIDTDREKVTIAYVDNKAPRHDRQFKLRTFFYIECVCKLCTDRDLEDELEEANEIYAELRDIDDMTLLERKMVILHRKLQSIYGDYNSKSIHCLHNLVKFNCDHIGENGKQPKVVYWQELKNFIRVLYGEEHPIFKSIIANYSQFFKL